MQFQHKGYHSFCPVDPPVITAWANTVGTKEADGPLCACFDYKGSDNYFGERTWEQAEQKMQAIKEPTSASML